MSDLEVTFMIIIVIVCFSIFMTLMFSDSDPDISDSMMEIRNISDSIIYVPIQQYESFLVRQTGNIQRVDPVNTAYGATTGYYVTLLEKR